MINDPLSHHAIVIGEPHARIHEGVMFSLSYADEAMADDAALNLLIHPIGYCHMRLETALGGDARVELFERVTTSNDGTPLTAYNRKRTDPRPANTLIYHTPTVSDTGTRLILSLQPGGGRGANSVGSIKSGFEEWVLHPGAKYLLRLTNISGGAQPGTINLDFYEPS